VSESAAAQTPEEFLVAASQQGERSAFEELVRRTARLVFSRAYLDTGDVHRAEDLTQETFLVAWRSIGQVKDRSGFRTWLLTILKTVSIDAARSAARKKRSAGVERVAGDAGAMLQVADARPTPGEVADRHEQREQALAALRELPEEYRQVIALRYLGGADYDTIGRQLALTNGSLRGLLHRGMLMLREKMNIEHPTSNIEC